MWLILLDTHQIHLGQAGNSNTTVLINNIFFYIPVLLKNINNMTKVTQNNWTSYARKVLSAQSKIANELLEVAEPQDNGAVAGPQEVVDAIEEIVEQLEEVSEAIPAEPSVSEEEVAVEAPEVEVEAEAPVAEEEEEVPMVAKLKAQVAALNRKVDAQEREKLAQTYSELFDDIKVAQAKFDEVLSSKDSLGSWQSKIAAIQAYKDNTGGNSQYASANNTSGFLSQSRVAKQQSGFTHL